MLKRLNRLLALAAALFTGLGLAAQMPEGANRTAPPTAGGDKNAIIERAMRRRTLANARESAAARAQAALKAKGGKIDPATFGVNPAAKAMAAQAAKVAAKGGPVANVAVPGPGFQLAQPDYMFGTASNWHNTKPIHKFIHSLPGLGAANANELGNFIPVAKPMANPYGADSDYYEIGVQQYTQQLHPELAPTKLRGYKDLNPLAENTANGLNSTNYLGPVIIAKRDRAVRIKMTNQLPTGAAGDLFIPVDTTMMGAGVGPQGGLYTQNRAEFHLHGGLSPWISDGTPHQWVTPAGEATLYPKGATFQNVPDMAAGATPGDGVATYFWSNQQSGRFMFYHDHSFGLTRLNVYAGEAAGYLIVDPVDDKLVNAGILPNNADLIKAGPNYYNYGVPLVIQDKTFVDTTKLGTVGVAGGTDPTWDVTKYGGDGSLWYPHVYMPNQNPADISGANAMGRWDYGAWFWPPLPLAVNNNGVGLQHGAEPVPGDPNGTEIPGTPNPSLVPEAFMDTPVVNGAAYPKLTVQPKAYRFRILNAANDRFWNLSLFQADPAALTEVQMVPATPNPLWPATWPTDGRDGGVPNPASAGPSFIQIGNESGFLPSPVVIPAQPVAYDYNRRNIVVLNILNKGLLLGPAERADVIVDFSAFAGKTLILYNDAPAPVPAFDARLDYYTGDLDQTASGGAPTTLAGFGPNTRTIMQITVAAGPVAPAFDMAALTAAFTSTATSNGAFAESQHLPIVPQAAYTSALNTTPATVASLTAAGMATTPPAFANNVYVRIQDNKLRYPFPAMENGTSTQPTLLPKAIQELFELDYGRMNATLGVELPLTNFTNQTTIPLGYADPTTEDLTDGTTQYWKITHNGVDTHPVHFHLFDVQVVNRVGWDGAVRLPDANELGWKETVKMNPLEDIIVAFRPLSPRMPANMTASTGVALPNSTRVPDVTKALGAPVSWTSPANGNPVVGTNDAKNYGWEYVWHCHILGHEENDFMRPMVLNVAATVPTPPTALIATFVAPGHVHLSWTDNSANETGFSIQRSSDAGVTFTEIGTTVPNQASFNDFTLVAGTSYIYRVLAYNQAGNSTPAQAAPVTGPTAKITGLIHNGASGVAGVTVTLSNGGGSVTTDANGVYTATVNQGWSGTATPSLLHYIFSPASRSYVNVTADQLLQDYAATPVIVISGTILDGTAAVPGVTVSLSTGQTTTTDFFGFYTFTVPSPWTGTITPTKLNYAFTPAFITLGTVALPVAVDQPNQNFAAQKIVTISGTVRAGTMTFSNVTMALSAGSLSPAGLPITSVLTDATGKYTVTVRAPYTGTITPSAPGLTFLPVSRSYAAILVDQLAQDYTAYATVSGTVTLPPVAPSTTRVPLAGVVLTYAGTGAYPTGTVSTDAAGAYAFTVTADWAGTVTPFKPGYFFTPLSRSYNPVATSQALQDYAAVNAVAVYGYVYDNAVPPIPVAGVTVTFTTTAGNVFAGSVTTDANGLFTHYVPMGWTGTVTPTKTSYRFNPVSRNYNNLTTSPSGGNFTAIPTVTISGTITTAGAPLAGVTVNYSGPRGGNTVTAANGTYSFIVDKGWNGTITPTLRATLFSPALVTFTTTPVLVDTPGVNFFTLQTISGTVWNTWPDLSVNPLPGATITLSPAGPGVSLPVLTDADGLFSVTVPTGFTGTLTPSKAGIVFNPVVISYATTPVMTNLNVTINSK